MNSSHSLDYADYFMLAEDPLHDLCTVSPAEDSTEDPLSDVASDPFVLARYIQHLHGNVPVDCTHPTYFDAAQETDTYIDESVVHQLVARSAHAEPWAGLYSPINGLPSYGVPSTTLGQEPYTSSTHSESVADSGYTSHISRPLICPVCSKSFKNRAEEKKHSSTHTRPFKCKVAQCVNVKGFATSNDLERHQKDIHLIQPRHGPRYYYKCALPTCSKRDKLWSRKDNFKAHILRMHKGLGIDVDRLIASSEFVPDMGDIEHLARNKSVHSHSRSSASNKVKARILNGKKTPEEASCIETASEPLNVIEGDFTQGSYPVWQANVPDFVEQMPQEAAAMVPVRVDPSNARLDLSNFGNSLAGLGMPQMSFGMDGGWELGSDTSYAFSHEGSSVFVGGSAGDFG